VSAAHPVRVGLDASAAATPRPTGVGLAIAHLAAALREAPQVELEVVYRLSRLRRRRHVPGPRLPFHPRLSRLLARRLDVFHGPDARLPEFRGPALVATVHDLSARRPGFASDRFRATREAHWEAVRERADLVVTYTHAVREELIEALGLPGDRIGVVPLAPTRALAPPPLDEARSVTARRVGDRPYVLALGELSARKNTVGALEAFAAAGLDDAALVLVGPPGHGAEAVEPAVARLRLGGRVVRPDYLPARDVAALLSQARALLFPTRYEGFGMPVLEAFRAGVPVVGSTAAAVVEVAGGAALHADPDDADALGDALRRVVRDEVLRADLIGRGRSRLADFTWERSAAGLVAVYQAAHEGRPAPSLEAPCSP
jgi:alpha-1,3-rhamnosyl/mannosyltransferase